MNRENIEKVFHHVLMKTFFILFTLYLLLPNALVSESFLCLHDSINVNSCLDQSWMTSINWALIKNFVFGKDYVFTYGPLGFLSTRTSVGFSPFYFLIFDLFVLSNFAFILIYVFRNFYSLLSVALTLIIAAAISSNAMYLEQMVFILLLISIFWLNYSIKNSALIGLIVPVVSTVLLFFIKVNISFVALAVFYLCLAYFIAADKQKRLMKILVALALPILIFALSFPLKTNLPGYIAGGLALIDGYNDAMNSRMREYVNYSNYALALLFVFFAVLFVRLKNLKREWLLFLICGIFSFVLFKQSFVRADLHVLAFFTIFPAVCGLVFIFYRQLSVFQIGSLSVICLICLVIGFNLDAYPALSTKLNYFTGIATGARETNDKLEADYKRFSLPPEILEKIGNQSVDIIPWNINLLFFNRLNYQPRPVIQSYGVFTPYLINLNGQSYEDERTAPQFVIFSNPSIDGRYSLFDDNSVKLDLIKHYSCLGLFNWQNSDFLLFQRKQNNTQISFSSPVEEKIKFGEDYHLKNTDQPYFVKIKIKYSLTGRAVRFFFKPFQLSLYFTLSDGTTRWHRAIVPILENGVTVNPYIENEKDFMEFAASGSAAGAAKKIKSFRIELDSVKPNVKAFGSKNYEEEIQLSVAEMSVVKNN